MRTLKRHSHEKGESLRSVRGSVIISILAKFILIFIYGYYFYSTLFHTTKSMAAVIFAELVLRRAGGKICRNVASNSTLGCKRKIVSPIIPPSYLAVILTFGEWVQ